MQRMVNFSRIRNDSHDIDLSDTVIIFGTQGIPLDPRREPTILTASRSSLDEIAMLHEKSMTPSDGH